MRLTISGKNFTLTEGIKDAAEEKIKGADLFCRRLNQFSLESLNEISETAVNSLVDRIEIREENELGKKSVLLDFYLVGIGKILS